MAIPNIGGGIYGFEPKNSSLTLMEEAFDTLLQIEAASVGFSLFWKYLSDDLDVNVILSGRGSYSLFPITNPVASLQLLFATFEEMLIRKAKRKGSKTRTVCFL